METLITHCAGMDVHQENIVVCAITGDAGGSPSTETRTFSTMTKSLFELLQWLESKEITHIAMESTGIYWRPVYNVLEGYFDIWLANAQRIKNVQDGKRQSPHQDSFVRGSLGSFQNPQRAFIY